MKQINPKIIKIILKHYFCNIQHLTSNEDILKYYFTLLDYVQKDSDISWEEIGSEYIIWRPFENTNPCDVIDNMEDLYKSIQEDLNLLSPNVLINPLEVASELAHNSVVNYFTDELGENFEYTDGQGDTFYNEDAQLLFNEQYSEILNIINKLKLCQ